MTEAEALPRAIERIYPPPGPDGIVVYAGDLDVQTNTGSHRAQGQLELHLSPDSWFGVHFKGSFRDLGPISFLRGRTAITVPAGASLEPPAKTRLPAAMPGGNLSEIRESVPAMAVGNLAASKRFLIHYTGPLRPRFRVLDRVAGGGHQGRINFTLPGWVLTMAPNDETKDDDFDGVIEAHSEEGGVTADDVDRLHSRLFAVLGLVAGNEIGIGPVCGLDSDGQVVWANWGAPRLRTGSGAGSWCPRDLIPTALPLISNGYGVITANPARETIIERAIEMLMSADNAGVVDVRVPIACSGLELLSWAVLRNELGMTRREADALNAGTALARLCRWAGIPTAVTDSLPHLDERLDRVGEDGWAGPDIVVNVRNKLLHPPSNPSKPQWPKPDEIVDAWELATWYLQLAILRLLDYRGQYSSRLALGRMESDTEAVPWASEP
jgi:hypothetical protein